jgi:hypothetical protein
MQIRILHTYIGMLIAPTVLFLATTGLLQIYNLHEAHPGYTPPLLIEKLSAIHKDQRFSAGHEEPHDAAPPHAAKPPAPHVEESNHERNSRAHLATSILKAFFAAVAIGLVVSTCLGIWMGLQHRLRRRTHLVLLVIGAVIPLTLAALTA